jgi:hypothetical protein
MTKKEESVLLTRITRLEKENEGLRKGVFNFHQGHAVSVPDNLRPIFDEAEHTVGSYFESLKIDPSHGSLEINNERYVLMRAESLSIGFLSKIKNLYFDKGEEEAYRIGRKLLFDLGHVIGQEDAKSFHKKMGLTDPISKLSAGPM